MTNKNKQIGRQREQQGARSATTTDSEVGTLVSGEGSIQSPINAASADDGIGRSTFTEQTGGGIARKPFENNPVGTVLRSRVHLES